MMHVVWHACECSAEGKKDKNNVDQSAHEHHNPTPVPSPMNVNNNEDNGTGNSGSMGRDEGLTRVGIQSTSALTRVICDVRMFPIYKTIKNN